jgi:hypothetical protein
MSLEHVPQRGKRSKQLERLVPAFADDDEVLTFAEWRDLNKLSERTARRIIASPDGPVVTQLSARCIGVTRRNNRLWQAARAR